MSSIDRVRRRTAPPDERPGGILWLGDPRAAEVGRVGGKAANLSRLADRWPVPAGFCLTADTHRSLSEIDDRVLTDVLRRMLAPAYRELAVRTGRRRPAVAVRSSAVDEDRAAASFAGQHETVLDVVGVASVAAAVVRCWRSADSEQVRRYRSAHGLAATAAVPVLVQQLVDADVAAVVFSADPVTGNRDEIVINATWGLGEALVAGAVTPDTYRLSREPLEVVARHVADKDVMTARSRRGTCPAPVPSRRRTRPALDRGRCLELGRLARDLESQMGWPVDIECAYAGRKLFLLQCRPITSLPAP